MGHLDRLVVGEKIDVVLAPNINDFLNRTISDLRMSCVVSLGLLYSSVYIAASFFGWACLTVMHQ